MATVPLIGSISVVYDRFVNIKITGGKLVVKSFIVNKNRWYFLFLCVFVCIHTYTCTYTERVRDGHRTKKFKLSIS